jgi:prophage antirepressor-like protein
MDNLSTFRFTHQEIRTITVDGTALFVANDVCAALDIDPSQTRRLDDSFKGLYSIQTPSGKQQMVVLSEAGVYRLAFTSRKPDAMAFMDWISKEVLPSIRKHGAYMTDEVLRRALEDPDTLIQLATRLKESKAEIAAQRKHIEMLEPKAEFYDAVAGSNAAISIGDLSKVLAIPGLGQNNLFKRLRELRILKGDNVPYQEFIDRGYFRIVEQKWNTPDGETQISLKTLVLPKGQEYIRKEISR